MLRRERALLGAARVQTLSKFRVRVRLPRIKLLLTKVHSMLHLRVDDDIKEQATAALTAIGSPILEK